MNPILFTKVERLADPTNKALGKKTYPVIVYKYSNPATLSEMAKEISSNSGVSEGESISVIKDFRTLLKKQLLSGRAVNIDGIGYFFLAAQSKGTANRADFTATDITGLRICFRAHNDIRLNTGTTTTRTDGLVLRDVDRLNDTGENGLPDGGGEPGDGGGEVVDPKA